MIIAHLVGGSRDGERRTLSRYLPFIDFAKLGPAPSSWASTPLPLEPVPSRRERYVYDSHDGPHCVIYRLEGIPPR